MLQVLLPAQHSAAVSFLNIQSSYFLQASNVELEKSWEKKPCRFACDCLQSTVFTFFKTAAKPTICKHDTNVNNFLKCCYFFKNIDEYSKTALVLLK